MQHLEHEQLGKYSIVQRQGKVSFPWYCAMNERVPERQFELHFSRVGLKSEHIREMLGWCLRLVSIILVRQCYKMPPIRQTVSQRIPLQLWTCFFSFWPLNPSGLNVSWNWAAITLQPCSFFKSKFPKHQIKAVQQLKQEALSRSGKLVLWVLYLRRISWSLISNSVSVPWNNMRLAVTESCLLYCQ